MFHKNPKNVRAIACLLLGAVAGPVVAADSPTREEVDALKQQVERLEQGQKSNQNLLDGLSKLERSPVTFSGFFSIGASQLSEDDLAFSYDTGQGSELSLLPTTYAGIQLNAELYKGGEFVYQVVAKGKDGEKDTYELQTEWLYLKHEFGAGFNMQAGRIRFPAFMDSENYYVGTTYPWVSPPTEIYEVLPLTNIDGFSLNHQLMLGDWSLASKLLLWGESSQGSSSNELRLNDMYGLALNLSNDYLNMRVAYMAAEEEIRIDSQPNGFLLAPLKQTFGDELEYLIAAVRYDDGLIFGSLESVAIEADKGVLDENRNWNITTGVHIGPVLAYIGYAESHVTNDEKIAAAINDDLNMKTILTIYGPLPLGNVFAPYLNRQQHTSTVGVKYDFSPKTALKVQVQYLDDFEGTSGNFTAGSRLPFKNVYVYDIAVQGYF